MRYKSWVSKIRSIPGSCASCALGIRGGKRPRRSETWATGRALKGSRPPYCRSGSSRLDAMSATTDSNLRRIRPQPHRSRERGVAGHGRRHPWGDAGASAHSDQILRGVGGPQVEQTSSHGSMERRGGFREPTWPNERDRDFRPRVMGSVFASRGFGGGWANISRPWARPNGRVEFPG